MSFDQRVEISAGIANLSVHNIPTVIDIIRTSMPSLVDGEVLEFDLNALDNTTLWQLHDFIRNCNVTQKPGMYSKKGSGVASFMAKLEKAQHATEQELQKTRAARVALGGTAGGSGHGMKTGGADDWTSDDDIWMR